MKKVLFLAIIGSLCFSAKAQVGIGAHAGVLFGGGKTNLDDDDFDEDFSFDKKPLVGFKVGVVADIPFGQHFSFMPELNYVSKGIKYNSNVLGIDLGGSKTTISTQFVELPLNFAFRTAKGGNNAFFAGLGPVVSFGVGGKYKGTEEDDFGDPISFSTKIKFDGKDDANDGKVHLKPLEIGANVFAGFEMKFGLYAKAYYNFGLNNLSPYDDDTFKTNHFGITFGYFFNRKK